MLLGGTRLTAWSTVDGIAHVSRAATAVGRSCCTTSDCGRLGNAVTDVDHDCLGCGIQFMGFLERKGALAAEGDARGQ